MEGLFGLGAGGEGGAGERLLFGQGAFAEAAGVSGGYPVLEPAAPGAGLVGGDGGPGRAVEQQIRVDDAEDAGQRVGVGAVCGDQCGPGPGAGSGVEGLARSASDRLCASGMR